MTTRKEREMMEAVLAYQKDTGKIARSITRAVKLARKDLADDIREILSVFMVKGGFKTKAEAQTVLDSLISESERQTLIRRAYATYEGAELDRALTRLSAPAYKWRITRKEAIARASQMAGDSLADRIKGILLPGVDKTIEEAVSRGHFEVQKDAGVALDWTLPNTRQMEAVHKEVGVYHKVKLFSAGELEDVRTEITEGILGGQDYDRISRRVEALTGKEAYKARRLVRTTMSQAAADARLKQLKELGITQYEIVCTYDERTCEICAQYDNRIFEVGKGPVPTFHPNCRCSISRVMPDKIRERMMRQARDENGKSIRVPKSMTYVEWREKYGHKSVTKVPSVKE